MTPGMPASNNLSIRIESNLILVINLLVAPTPNATVATL